MTHRGRLALGIGVAVAAWGCGSEGGPTDGAPRISADELGTPHACTLTGQGSLATGEAFVGSASYLGGVAEATWVHEAPGLRVASDGPPVEVICRVNGGIVADFWGAATLNGEPGYTYSVHVVDNRGPPVGESIVVEASWQVPGLPHPGVARFTDPHVVRIPEVMQVTDGSARRGSVLLTLDHTLCWYRGNGTAGGGGDAFEFVRCVGDGGRHLVPGDLLEVTRAALTLLALPCCGAGARLEVEAEIGVGFTYPGPLADEYYLLLGDPSGSTILYSVSGDVASGDGGDVTIVLRD